MSSHKTCHLSKTGLWVSFSQWLSFLITNSLWDFYTYREWFLPTTTPLKTVATTQQNEYTHLQLSFQTGQHQSEFTHTYICPCRKWRSSAGIKQFFRTGKISFKFSHLHAPTQELKRPTCSAVSPDLAFSSRCLWLPWPFLASPSALQWHPVCRW